MSAEILHLITHTSDIETKHGRVDFSFTNAIVNPDRSLSASAYIDPTPQGVDLSFQLSIPHNQQKLKPEIKKVKEQAYTMQSGLAVIEKMRHSLFDYDYTDRYFYDGVMWNLSRLALSHSLAVQNNDIRANRFRIDRPYIIEQLVPVVGKLINEVELHGQPQNMIHESIREKTLRVTV